MELRYATVEDERGLERDQIDFIWHTQRRSEAGKVSTPHRLLSAPDPLGKVEISVKPNLDDGQSQTPSPHPGACMFLFRGVAVLVGEQMSC